MSGTFLERARRLAGAALQGARRFAAEHTVRLAVTGLSGAGKTVFVAALVQNMRLAKSDRTRLPFLGLAAAEQIVNVRVRRLPGVRAFPLRRTLAALERGGASWPPSTRALSGLRLAIDYRPQGWITRALSDRARLNVEIIDYPGEWLLDLAMQRQDFAAWSAAQLAAMEREPRAALAAEFRALAAGIAPGAAFDPALLARAHAAYVAYLRACRAEPAGLSNVQPGRFLVPGEDAALVEQLAFVPLAGGDADAPPWSWAGTLRARYDGYVRAFVAPFFARHFRHIDRQIVLVDLLAALQRGHAATEDLRAALDGVLAALRYGPAQGLASWTARRIRSVVIAASKADHVTPDQYPAMIAALQHLTEGAAKRMAASGTVLRHHALAAIRCTRVTRLTEGDVTVPALEGRVLATGEVARLYPGVIPPRIAGAADWPADTWHFVPFALPAPGPAWYPNVGLSAVLEDLLAEAVR